MSQQQVSIPSPLNAGDSLLVNVGTGIVSVSVTGPSTVQEGAQAQFTATVKGTGNLSVIWSASDGSISATGLFTAPAKVENVTIKATSVQDSTKSGSQPVAVSQPSNTVTIAPSGGDDTAALQSALNAAAKAGQILRMLAGTWNLSPISIPTLNMLIDPTAILKDRLGYGKNDCMLNPVGNGLNLTGVGAQIQMPNSYAASLKDLSQWRHGVRLQGSLRNMQISGLSVIQAGGDGFYVRESSAVLLTGVSASACFRNGLSITGQVNGVTVTGCNFSNQQNQKIADIADGIDVESNLPTDYQIGVRIENCVFTMDQMRGLFISLWFMNSTSQTVTVDVSNCHANSSGDGFNWTNGQNSKVPHIFTGSGNTINGVPTSFPAGL